jgi:hypothetical protein
MSYAGALGFGFTVARNAVPNASELAECLSEAYQEMLGLLDSSKKKTSRHKDSRRHD